MKKQQPTWLTEEEVDALLLADLHLRLARPIGRKDDWRSTMIDKLIFIRALQETYHCPVLGAGDIFDHWKATPDLLTIAEEYLPEQLITIPGQHDLPLHSFEQFSKSALYHLHATGRVGIPLPEYYSSDIVTGAHHLRVCGFKFGEELFTPDRLPPDLRNVALIHQFAYRGRRPWPGCEAEGLRSIAKKLEGFDLIVIGDNHKPFTYKDRGTGQLIVNCGSMMRTTADQIDHKPRVWAYNAEANEVWPIFIPIEEDAISREHLEQVEIRNERIDAFVQRLTGEFDIGVSFERNLGNFIRANKVRPLVQRKIYEATEVEDVST